MKTVSSAAFGALILVAACGPEKELPATEGATVAATVVTVHTESFAGAIDAIGAVTVRPGHIASLGAPGPGRVSTVRVAVGDRVQVGAILVELDAAPFVSAVQSAAAALQTTTRTLERAQRLVDAGIAPRKDLDVATSDLAQATATLATASRLRSLATLRSPIDGVVTRLFTTLGATVDGTSTLVEVADPRAVDVVLSVTAAEAAQIVPGASVTLSAGQADGDDSLGTGIVTSVGAAIDSATRTVAVRVTPSRTTRALRIGESMNGRVTLEVRGGALLVPASAVVPDGDAFRVFVVDTGNIAHARAVTVGSRRAGRVEILSGLAAAERIVTDGAYQVDDGVHIVARVK